MNGESQCGSNGKLRAGVCSQTPRTTQRTSFANLRCSSRRNRCSIVELENRYRIRHQDGHGLAVSKLVRDVSWRAGRRRTIRTRIAVFASQQTEVVAAFRHLGVEEHDSRRLVDDSPVQVCPTDVEDAHRWSGLELAYERPHARLPKQLGLCPEPISQAFADQLRPRSLELVTASLPFLLVYQGDQGPRVGDEEHCAYSGPSEGLHAHADPPVGVSGGAPQTHTQVATQRPPDPAARGAGSERAGTTACSP